MFGNNLDIFPVHIQKFLPNFKSKQKQMGVVPENFFMFYIQDNSLFCLVVVHKTKRGPFVWIMNEWMNTRLYFRLQTSHSQIRSYLYSNLYGRAPRGVRGVKNSENKNTKNCWVLSLELSQNWGNFKKLENWKKIIKNHAFL